MALRMVSRVAHRFLAPGAKVSSSPEELLLRKPYIKSGARMICEDCSNGTNNPFVRKSDLVEFAAKQEGALAQMRSEMDKELLKKDAKIDLAVLGLEKKLEAAVFHVKDAFTKGFNGILFKQAVDKGNIQKEFIALSKSFDVLQHKTMETVNQSHLVWMRSTLWVVIVGTTLSSKLDWFPALFHGATPEPKCDFGE